MNSYDSLFGDATIAEIFSAKQTYRSLLSYEAVWAEALAAEQLIPAEAATLIATTARALPLAMDDLMAQAPLAGNLALPLVNALKTAVAATAPAAARYVHWGATSQDAIDTAAMLQAVQALSYLLALCDRLRQPLRALCEAHRATPMLARTLLQAAEPTVFGLKVAGWLVAIHDVAAELAAVKAGAALQYGGASGNLAALGEKGLVVNARVAQMLGLTLPPMPWHTQRQRVVSIGSALGMLLGTLGKIARDLSLLAQSEVAEISEPSAPGRGASSAMPHKQNPVGCLRVLAAALRAPGLVATLFAAQVQEHERALGGWHAEWEVVPELFRLAGGALGTMREVLPGLVVHVERMQTNLMRALPHAAPLNLLLVNQMIDRALAHAPDGT